MNLPWFIVFILDMLCGHGFPRHGNFSKGRHMAFSRRDFAKLSAMGLAAKWAPRGLAQVAAAPVAGDDRRIGYAVIGLGRIASHFLEGTKNSAQSKITALVSGHRDKAERIAAQYGVPLDSIYSYEDFDRIAANKSVDAVYVALPNSMHAEYTLRAAKAGKHVLCEKPMDINSAQCLRMIDACKAAHVKLMIAYRLHYEPITLKALDIVRSGKLGQLQSMQSCNGMNIAQNEWRTTKALGGGGSMFDLGIYELNASRTFTGEEPISYQAQASTIDKNDCRFAEVEETVTWLMRFPSGALATGAASYGASMGSFYRMQGAQGFIEVGTFGYQGVRMQGHYAFPGQKGVALDETNPEPDPMQFVREVDHFSDCILNDRTPNTPGEEGVADMRAIEAVYKAAGVKL
jgi:predicted dehydrogenase